MTDAPGDEQWLGLHIYYRSDQDALLVDAVAPLVAELSAAGDVVRFFFLRYWQGGLHVRLRLLCPRGRIDGVRDHAGRHLERYLAANPSVQPVDADGHVAALRRLARLEGVAADVTLTPDNTVRTTEYEPELGKYGGPEGVRLAEAIFHRSSEVVLASLPAVRVRRELRLGLGYRAMLAAIRATGMRDEAAMVFLNRYCKVWLPYAPPGAPRAWENRLATRPPERKAGDGHRAAAGPAVDASTARWAEEVGAVLNAASSETGGILDAVTTAGPAASRADRLAHLLLNFLHTHNNRLGITPAHEAYLAFTGYRMLAASLGVEPDPDLVFTSSPEGSRVYEYR